MNPNCLPRLVAIALAILLPAHESLAQGAPAPRPKVGLVLGGGGARGGAHLGVLEVLDEMRVPFDCVAGTSMGALVGGAFVAGVSPAEMRETIGKTDWNSLFDDSAGRDAVNLRRKTIDDRFYSGLEFGVTPDGLRYREGAVAGEKIKLFLNELVRAGYGERTIERLPLPLTLIATDIGTGERVAMRSGNLTSAMRASMSVPGAIAPVMREGRKLVDGGLVDNVPIQEVRDRCGAEVVIAVNVGSPLLKGEQVTGVLSVVGQMVNLLTEQNVAKSLALVKSGDIYMRPELGDITAADFGRQLEAAAIGRRSALEKSKELAALSVSHEEYQAWRRRVRVDPGPQPPVIHEVRVDGTRFVNAAELRENISQKPGEVLDSERLAKDIVLVYSEGDLQTLDYSVLSERDKNILRITPVEKSWGPNYLRFGMNLASDLDNQATYNLRALYRKSWLNSYGGEWLAALQIGSEQGFGTEFYQPVDFRRRWFLRPFLSYLASATGIYLDGNRLAEYGLRQLSAGLDVGVNIGTTGQASVGWLERNLRATRETGSSLLPDAKERIGGLDAKVALDTLDFAFFPTRGYKVDGQYFQGLRSDASVGNYAFGELQAAVAGSFGDFVVLGSGALGRTTKGSLPLADTFALGGRNRLSAFTTDQIRGEGYDFASLQLQYQLTKPVPVLGLRAIAGITFESGRMKNPVTESNLTGRLDSYGAYIAANTPFGPMYLGYADSPQSKKGRFYFFLGTP